MKRNFFAVLSLIMSLSALSAANANASRLLWGGKNQFDGFDLTADHQGFELRKSKSDRLTVLTGRYDAPRKAWVLVKVVSKLNKNTREIESQTTEETTLWGAKDRLGSPFNFDGVKFEAQNNRLYIQKSKFIFGTKKDSVRVTVESNGETNQVTLQGLLEGANQGSVRIRGPRGVEVNCAKSLDPELSIDLANPRDRKFKAAPCDAAIDDPAAVRTGGAVGGPASGAVIVE
jgi:hypothetical protein